MKHKRDSPGKRKLKKFLPLLFVLLLVCAGCARKQDTISGTYEAGSEYGKTVYVFDEDHNASVSYLSLGETLMTLEGSYEINEDGNLITFTFPVDDTFQTKTLDGISSFSGSFSFVRGDETLTIGNVLYQKTQPVQEDTDA